MATLFRPQTSPARFSSPICPQSNYSALSTIRRITPSPDFQTNTTEGACAAHLTTAPRVASENGAGERYEIRLEQTNEQDQQISDTCKERTEAKFDNATMEESLEEPGRQEGPSPLRHRQRTFTSTRIPQPVPAAKKVDITSTLIRKTGARTSPTTPSHFLTTRRHLPLSAPDSLLSHAGNANQNRTRLPSPAKPQSCIAKALTQLSNARALEEADRPFTDLPLEDPFVSRTESYSDPSSFSVVPPRAGQPAISRMKRIQAESPSKCRKPTSRTPASVNSTTSTKTTFSTLGRDEMERKGGNGDEGPFKRAKSMCDLRNERRRISDGGRSIKSRGVEDAAQRDKKQTRERKRTWIRCQGRCNVM